MSLTETNWFTRPRVVEPLRHRHEGNHHPSVSCFSLGASFPSRVPLGQQRPPGLGLRTAALFAVGIMFALLFNLLLKQHHVYTEYGVESSSLVFSCKWWMPPCFGLASIIIGLGHPLLDSLLDSPHLYKREWSSVIRCLGLFIGLGYAGAKLPNVTNVQLSCVLALMAVGLWYLFDKTSHGFMFSLAFALISTAFSQLLVYWDHYRFLQPDFLWVRSWITCVMFAASVCFGNIGRQLVFTQVSSPAPRLKID
eukprot:comp34742_c0_seq1/m.47306 comp34742_c0_seq1/g.47306  ORF comp34742_c0_seq1/g.47306 comp34742_c0_seq1/m.47306 type:complete len:252 (-) comp34742_c0_seq1:669-1424(-)